MAVGQNLTYLFWDDYPPKVVYFKGFWDVHRGTGVLTHCHMFGLTNWPSKGMNCVCVFFDFLSKSKYPSLFFFGEVIPKKGGA